MKRKTLTKAELLAKPNPSEAEIDTLYKLMTKPKRVITERHRLAIKRGHRKRKQRLAETITAK